ncbi:MAG: LacI family DNA-binding transcriptional regulator [Anaerolineae bacterium]|nr:LacI family DNA-binding transcriptional regulator [Anaerolineae bacterium]
MTPSTITLRDVAALAGVSMGTASQALNNRPHVALETRARVLEAAQSLGYRPPRATLGHHTLSVVGMIVKHDVGEPFVVNPFYSYIQAGIEQECQRSQLSLMVANIEVDRRNRPVSWPPMMLDRRIDGVLIVGAFVEDTIHQIRQHSDIPIVLVDGYAEGNLFDSVVIDNVNGAYAAVRYLIERGHTRIALVGTAPDSYPGLHERRTGYIRALKRSGIRKPYFADFDVTRNGLTRENGYDAARELLGRAPEITALLASNDQVAVGALNAVRDLGRAVPGDVSIIGFDDQDVSHQVSPALTTVRVHKTWMGKLAVEMLRRRAEQPDRPITTLAVSTELVIRASVRSMENRLASRPGAAALTTPL